MSYQNDLILRTIAGEKTERVPVWMMRQAGRILPEYRALRKEVVGFKALVENPALACEVTLQPVRRFQPDAAIIFSDILVVPEAMGCVYEMEEKKGPVFPNPIKSALDIERLLVADPEEKLGYVLEAIRLTVKALDNSIPLIGFAGAPWTIFAYMIEGKGSKTFSEAKKWLYTAPDLSHKLLEKITLTTIQYLQAQVKAGAAFVQVFDSWAGLLSPDQYSEFAIPYLRRITEAMNVPVTIFSKGAFYALEELAQMPKCNTIGLDWNIRPEWAKSYTANKCLQGNLDPCVLYGSTDQIIGETQKMLASFGGKNHIANLGHGVYPDTDYEKVNLFFDTVKQWKNE